MKHKINQSRICKTKITWTRGFRARLHLLTLAFTKLAAIERRSAGTSSASKSRTNKHDKIIQASSMIKPTSMIKSIKHDKTNRHDKINQASQSKSFVFHRTSIRFRNWWCTVSTLPRTSTSRQLEEKFFFFSF